VSFTLRFIILTVKPGSSVRGLLDLVWRASIPQDAKPIVDRVVGELAATGRNSDFGIRAADSIGRIRLAIRIRVARQSSLATDLVRLPARAPSLGFAWS